MRPAVCLLLALLLGSCIFFQSYAPPTRDVERACEDLADADEARRDAGLAWLEEHDIWMLKGHFLVRYPDVMARCARALAALLAEPQPARVDRAVSLLANFSISPQRPEAESVVPAVLALAAREWSARRPTGPAVARSSYRWSPVFQKGPTLEPGSYIVLAGAITVLNRYDALRGREAWLREILADGAVQRSADADDTGAYLLRHEAHSALEALTRAP